MGILKKKSISALLSATEETERPNLKADSMKDLAEQFMNTDDKKERKKILEEFKKRRLEFADFIKNNPDVVNAEVERALLAAAVGGTYTDVEVTTDKNGHKRVKRTIRQVAPNPKASGKWLTNRDPENWSDKPMEDPELEDTSDIEEALYGKDD